MPPEPPEVPELPPEADTQGPLLRVLPDFAVATVAQPADASSKSRASTFTAGAVLGPGAGLALAGKFMLSRAVGPRAGPLSPAALLATGAAGAGVPSTQTVVRFAVVSLITIAPVWLLRMNFVTRKYLTLIRYAAPLAWSRNQLAAVFKKTTKTVGRVDHQHDCCSISSAFQMHIDLMRCTLHTLRILRNRRRQTCS